METLTLSNGIVAIVTRHAAGEFSEAYSDAELTNIPLGFVDYDKISDQLNVDILIF